MTDRFANPLRLDQIRDGERLDLVAGEAERRDIARRLDLASLERLEAHVRLTRTGDMAVRAEGRVVAALEQSCVVTREPVSAYVDEPFEVLFVPEPAADPDEEIELGASDCDVVFHDGAVIDLGMAIADTLALSLDPYPRGAGAEAALKEAGVMTEQQASPFAVLAQLKRGDRDKP